MKKKIRNPKTKRPITIGGKVYRGLIDEGYANINGELIIGNTVEEMIPLKKEDVIEEVKKEVVLVHKIIMPDGDIEEIIHMSDIHVPLGLERKNEYISVLNDVVRMIKELDNKRRVIVITGDIFHVKVKLEADSVMIVRNFLKNLGMLYPVAIITGNHDCNEANLDLIDSLTPVCDGIDNIYYLRNSGSYRFGNVVFVVSSLLDGRLVRAEDIKRENGLKYYYLYHGMINTKFGNSTRTRKVSDFSGFDAVLLGDIHTMSKIRGTNYWYAGSLVQRNFGERVDGHGFLIWDVKNDTPVFCEVHNKYGMVTLFINDVGDIEGLNDIPKWIKKVKFRCKAKNIGREVMLKVEDTLYKLYDGCIVVWMCAIDSVTVDMLPVAKVGIDYEIQEIERRISDKDMCKSMIKLYNKIATDCKETVNSKEKLGWIIKELRFKNMFGYGGNIENRIAFINGVNYVSAPNTWGKSSIMYLILYALTDHVTGVGQKNKVGVLHNKSNEGYVEITLIGSDGVEYHIEKYLRSKYNGDINRRCNFWKIADSKVRLNGSTTTETLGIIKFMFGDFNYIASNNVICDRIQHGPVTMTGSELMKWLNSMYGLDRYDKYIKYCRSLTNSAKSELKNTEGRINYADGLVMDNIDESRDELTSVNNNITILREKEMMFVSKKNELLKIIDELVVNPIPSRSLDDLKKLKCDDVTVSKEYLLGKIDINLNNELLEKLLMIKNMYNPSVGEKIASEKIILLTNSIGDISFGNTVSKRNGDNKIKCGDYDEIEMRKMKKELVGLENIDVLKSYGCSSVHKLERKLLRLQKLVKNKPDNLIKIDTIEQYLNEYCTILKINDNNYNHISRIINSELTNYVPYNGDIVECRSPAVLKSLISDMDVNEKYNNSKLINIEEKIKSIDINIINKNITSIEHADIIHKIYGKKRYFNRLSINDLITMKMKKLSDIKQIIKTHKLVTFEDIDQLMQTKKNVDIVSGEKIVLIGDKTDLKQKHIELEEHLGKLPDIDLVRQLWKKDIIINENIWKMIHDILANVEKYGESKGLMKQINMYDIVETHNMMIDKKKSELLSNIKYNERVDKKILKLKRKMLYCIYNDIMIIYNKSLAIRNKYSELLTLREIVKKNIELMYILYEYKRELKLSEDIENELRGRKLLKMKDNASKYLKMYTWYINIKRIDEFKDALNIAKERERVIYLTKSIENMNLVKMNNELTIYKKDMEWYDVCRKIDSCRNNIKMMKKLEYITIQNEVKRWDDIECDRLSRMELDDIEKKLEEIRKNIYVFSERHDNLISGIKSHDDCIEDVVIGKKKLRQLDESLALYGRYMELFLGKNSIPHSVLRTRLTNFENRVNSILAKYTKYKLIMLLDVTKKKEKNKRSISMIAIDGKHRINVNRLSGYERLILNLSICSASMMGKFLMIDESFDCIDKDRFASSLPEIIDILKENYNSILMISHRDVDPDVVDKRILINRIGSCSVIGNKN